jgi:prepilin-type processing-associated H-X9-DG protein
MTKIDRKTFVFKPFSLVELLIMMAIFAILISLLQPSLRGLIFSSQDIQCAQNLREWGVMHAQHEDDFNGLAIHITMYTPNSVKKHMNWPQYINYYMTGHRNKKHPLNFCPIEDSVDGRGYGMNRNFGAYTEISNDPVRNTQYIHPQKTIRQVDTWYWFFRDNINPDRHDRISLRHRYNANALWLDGHASLEFAEELAQNKMHFAIR